MNADKRWSFDLIRENLRVSKAASASQSAEGGGRMSVLQGKSIVLGVTGGIAAYKVVEVSSRLVKSGATVDVIMTEAATEFVGPLTFQAITHRPVVTEMFALLQETEIGHVSLAHRADLLIIAPLTANTLAKLAGGLADNMLTATALATRAPLLLAPAMETGMWENPITQANWARLQKARDVTTVGPAHGRLASGGIGPGRMVEPVEVVEAARWVLGRGEALAGQQVVVTAGGTREPLDPVRVLTNRSSGKMGDALARAARDRGAKVTLIHAPVALPIPWGVTDVEIETTQQMRDAVLAALPQTDVLIMAAAPVDFRPASVAGQKIKKQAAGEELTLDLERTPDILLEVAARRDELGRPLVTVGFAAETEGLIENARHKLRSKRLDLIAANDPRQAMGAEASQVTLLDTSGGVEELPPLPKAEVAERVVKRVIELIREEEP
jgi:phosphopantothenoylcysteine decarboxylase/phosphopantothenate--cysteine ligase